MKVDATTLPDDAPQLKQMLVDFQEHYDKETGILLEQISHLHAQLFGRKSEKIKHEDGPQPLPLFDMPEPVGNDDEEAIPVPAHNRRKRGRKVLPEIFPRIERIHDIADADKICGCGCDLSRIGEEVSEQLDIVPSKVRVIRNIRPKYACKNCEGVKDNGPSVKIAPVHPQIIPKSIVSSGLLAHILTAKFIDHTPFYRQEKLFVRLGLKVSRTSMCNWAMQASTACQPLLNLHQDEVLSGSYVNIDETPLQVLKEPGRDPTTKSYMWIFRRGDPDKSVLIYQYQPTRGGDVVREFPGDFQGYVQTDGYSGYDFLDHRKGVRHIGCWAHSRCKFMDVIKAQGKNRKTGSADKALSFIRKLYKLEKEAREKELSPEEIYQIRQDKSKPILDDFKKWLSKRQFQTPPKGLLGKAIAYTLNQWHRHIGYIEDGQLAPDNNMAENNILPFCVGRRNWLFSGMPEGAEASALLYSLIKTAKMNNLEPYAYLHYIFDNLPMTSSLEDYEALLPWSTTPQQINRQGFGGGMVRRLHKVH
ncbi:MAG: IS66 family transposase [Desulfobulbaceae bacterium]|nr:IS66 family transposase [Desulfobulbaceae bacterium]